MHDLSNKRVIRPIRVEPSLRSARRRQQGDWRPAWTGTGRDEETDQAGLEATRRAVTGAAIEASKAVFSASQSNSAALRQQANAAYGNADGLDRTTGPFRKVTI